MRKLTTPQACAAGMAAVGLTLAAVLVVTVAYWNGVFSASIDTGGEAAGQTAPLKYLRRVPLADTSGFSVVSSSLAWDRERGLDLRKISDLWSRAGYRRLEQIELELRAAREFSNAEVSGHLARAGCLHYEGDPRRGYELLQLLRGRVEDRDDLAESWLYTIIYFQGISALRRGEDDNCILCRGESSCIFPIVPAAVHLHPEGSRLAVKHFTEYLQQFPDDLEVIWLLNLAHMTLGEHPHKMDPQFVLSFDRYLNPGYDIGKFRDVGHLVGVNRFNQAGGAIMDDFDNDGLLDIVITSFDPLMPMAFYRNRGDGTFEDRTAAAGLSNQLGGLYCVQGDYNNDGKLDIFIPRGAWLNSPVRPTLLRNDGGGKFTDVTEEAGLIDPVNSISAAWVDFDNDGALDLFICCDRQPNRLYRNKGNGTFEEVAAKAGLCGTGQPCKGSAWLDYDNDGYPDVFLNYLSHECPARLHRNNRNGTFTDVSDELNIRGPVEGFSCWAWDYDNDGWLDIFATSYDRTVTDIVNGLLDRPHKRFSNKLYRNLQGKGFEDVTREAGLDLVFAAMGNNFADFDNDGYLDFYLGTGDPQLATLVPNRMFKNLAGKRFVEITGPSGTGHLQKGHAVACGDWNRDGNVDIFIEMGGAINGDKYHNILFQNPGQGNHWLNVKLVGQKTNRAAIGARLAVTTAGEKPLTVHRHIGSGSSFGANTLEQTIGLGKATKVARLEVHWPTSGTTQVFHDLAADQAIEVTEFAKEYRQRAWKPIPLPAEPAAPAK